MRRECVAGSYVFIKGHASTECTDTREPGRNEVMAKIAEVITHLVIRLLALRVKGKGCWCLDFNKEHGVLIKLDGKQCDERQSRRGGFEGCGTEERFRMGPRCRKDDRGVECMGRNRRFHRWRIEVGLLIQRS